ncbi:5800_t:CDS:10 [Paraglomus occultum]|uniref:5800_t:CDS:1 n=1 Tax=Paraglomus occultum TaxID=144539 RepID=A0A9N9B1F3_9GLOM|nr:5800_t:CDS:10 [Paraglomus occultum]
MVHSAASSQYILSSDGTHYVLNHPIEKSDSDDRTYKMIKLKNDLEAMIIHDEKTDKASAALDVHVGYDCDPIHLQGLAHFCEHLLFMGTKKYPKENDYNEYLSGHSGNSNAWTGPDSTNYFFEVGGDHLEGALDRFSQFFINSLFDPSCTERELRAVDSENKKNLQDDGWRLDQLEKSLSNPNHVYHKFGTGSLETLRDQPLKNGIDVREELLKFYERYYSANLMKLCVLGKEPLDVLTRWVVEYFSDIRNKSLPVPVAEGSVLTENELLRVTFAKPVKDIRYLELPGGYLSHLIGHEGSGSILSLLKKLGWANSLASGSYNVSVGCEFFRIQVDLTEEGLKHYEDVVKVVFQYIDMLKREGFKKWIFDENASLAAIGFRFVEKFTVSEYASFVTQSMQRPYPREWVLSGPYLIRECDSAQIEDALNHLRQDRFTLMVVGKTLEGLDQKERWYGTEYSTRKFGDDFLKELKNLPANPELSLPQPNDFIPENFETHKQTDITPAKHPTLIKNSRLARVWHKKDDKFWTPKVNLYFMFRTPCAYITPIHCVKTRLYTDLICDALTEYAYVAEVAGLSYAITNDFEGITLRVGGFNDKVHILLEKIVSLMRNFKVDPERFALIKEQLERHYRNNSLEPPYIHALYYIQYLTQELIWTAEEKLEVLDPITAEDVQSFYPELLNHLHVETLIHGNMFEDEALRAVKTVEDILAYKPLIPSQMIRRRPLLLPESGHFVYQRKVFDEKEVNSSIVYYVDVGKAVDVKLRARLALLVQIADEPFFDQLRTKEQLGYVVRSRMRNECGSIGMEFIVQSVKDTVHLENRIEAFLSKLQSTIETMSEEEYQKHVQSLITTRLEKDKNLGEESQRYWIIIYKGLYNFFQVDQDVEELKTISKSSLLDFFNEYVHTSSKTRKKLSTHLRSQNPPPSSPHAKTFDINRLFSCLQSHSLTSEITLADLSSNLESKNFGSPDGQNALKKFLADKTKADDKEIEQVIKKVNQALVVVSNKEDSQTKVEVDQEVAKDSNETSRDDSVLSEKNVVIEDLAVFKSNMKLGPAPTTTIPFETLSKSDVKNQN